MSEQVNPSIVGGFVARVGSLVFVASLTWLLEQMKQRLLQET